MTLLELIVSAVLASCLFAVVGPMVSQCTRVLRDSRDSQRAMDEALEQLDRLAALPSKNRERAMESLELSSPLRSVLPNATIEGEIKDDDLGTRLIIRVSHYGNDHPRTTELVRWLDTPPAIPAAPPPTTNQDGLPEIETKKEESPDAEVQGEDKPGDAS